MGANTKTYSVITRSSKTFNLLISGFRSATTFIFRIRDKVSIAFVSTLASKISTTMNLKRIRMIVSQVKLTTKMTQTINSKRISITYIFRQRMKSVATIYSYSPILFSSKVQQKILSSIKQGILSIGISPTLASFYTLGDHDAKTLGEMDLLTLGELDYETV